MGWGTGVSVFEKVLHNLKKHEVEMTFALVEDLIDTFESFDADTLDEVEADWPIVREVFESKYGEGGR